jgi:hypothetical protein
VQAGHSAAVRRAHLDVPEQQPPETFTYPATSIQSRKPLVFAWLLSLGDVLFGAGLRARSADSRRGGNQRSSRIMLGTVHV